MQKSSAAAKGFVNEGRRRTPVKPVPINMDVIAVMSDEEIMNQIRLLDESMQRVPDPYFWEVEVAYLRREQSIRRARREAHDQWCQTFMDEPFTDEGDLPVADLDNSAFLEFNR